MRKPVVVLLLGVLARVRFSLIGSPPVPNYTRFSDRLLVLGTSEADMLQAVAWSKQRNAGWVYVTNDDLPNPWDTLPSDPYWSNELNAINQP
jgi:hypothetical protein